MMPYSTEIKWVIGAGIVLALIFGGYKLYNLGWEAREAKIVGDNNIAIQAAVEQARIEWQSTQSITQAGMQNVQDTKQKIIYITQQAEQIVAPKCTDLGVGYAGLYNQYIGAIQGHTNSGGNLSDAKVSGQPADVDANPNR